MEDRSTKGCLRLYTPSDDRAQFHIEAQIYFGKFDTIVLRRDLRFAVYVNGILHSIHSSPMAADLALRSATNENGEGA
jgi:hypothetical protein